MVMVKFGVCYDLKLDYGRARILLWEWQITLFFYIAI